MTEKLLEGSADSGDDIGNLWKTSFLQVNGIGHGHISTSDSLHWSIQIVESVACTYSERGGRRKAATYRASRIIQW